jgi:arylsulfatase
VEPYLEMRRRIDGELSRRTNDFIRRQVNAKRPFFAYVPLTQLHFPTLPHRDFEGKTGRG